MTEFDVYTQRFERFPARSDHARRWRELARAIAGEADRITDDAERIARSGTPGELVILGSGIEAVGFVSSDEFRIREAEYVFYCVADPATEVWIKALRPDAYDLYVLYDDTKVRYTTYMQMTEAMLHYVRKGKRVVSIFYGHPGIFVLSTHRAVQICRREGHAVLMRPGVSALDTLCADLGVDPSQPGMQTFEATDMLIRHRRPDPGIHLVLWQVGLIGELGYRRQGPLNSRFSVLLDYLEEFYGPDQEVVNYIGSRYPGIEPLIDRHTISSLRDPRTREKVTGISTFYLPPSAPAASDEDMLRRLGLLRPGQTTRRPETSLRIIDRYGRKERKAFEDFARFDVPSEYHWQSDTAAARFILSLRENGPLRTRYSISPREAVASWNGGLNETERRRLERGDAGAMQIAAKGMRTQVAPAAAKLISVLLTEEQSSRALLRAALGAGDPHAGVEGWVRSRGLTVDWESIADDLAMTLRYAMYPWTGCYLAPGKGLSVILHGLPSNPDADRVYVNGIRIHAFRSLQGSIQWRAEDGNATSGLLQRDRTPRGARRLVGAIWPAGETATTHHHVVALEHRVDNPTPLASFAGTYHIKSAAGRINTISVIPDWLPEQPCMSVTVDGMPATDNIRTGSTIFSIDGTPVPFSAFIPSETISSFERGEYRVRCIQRGQARMTTITLCEHTIVLQGRELPVVKSPDRYLRWAGGEGPLELGQIKILLDPISLAPMLFGSAGSLSRPNSVLLRGMAILPTSLVARRAAVPDHGLPAWAWQHLLLMITEASERGGLFLWHGWMRSVGNLRRLRRVMRMLEGA